ncbi:MAG: glycosyltransferase family 2 protein [Candidatus Pacearchaeota archaeon]
MAIPILPQLPLWTVYPILAIGFFIAFFYVLVLIIGKEEEPLARKFFPEVAFVIPAKNVERYIERCVKSVLNQDYKNRIYIVVVNDASIDNTSDVVKRLIKRHSSSKRKIILLDRKKSVGRKAPVLNEGIKYVLKNLDVEIIAPLDADTFIAKDILKKAMGFFEQDANVVAITCPLLPYKPRKFLEKMQHVEYVMAMFFRKLLSRINALCFTPAFSIFRTSFFKEAGLYSEKTWTEDFEIALRVRSRFYKIVQIDSQVRFIAPESLGKLYKERVRWAHGTFQALFKDYSYMISPKYGMVGTFFLPVTVALGIALIIAALVMLIYGAIAGITTILHQLSIGWKPVLEFKINFFDISVLLSDPRFILGLAGVLISVIFLGFAQKYSGKKINLLHYFVFFIPYTWFLAYTQLEGLIRYIFKLKMSWGEMHK